MSFWKKIIQYRWDRIQAAIQHRIGTSTIYWRCFLRQQPVFWKKWPRRPMG